MGELLNFSEALDLLKEGKRVSRTGWNGKGMWLSLAKSNAYIVGDGTTEVLNDHIVMKTADGTYVPWLASQTDLLAEDWGTV